MVSRAFFAGLLFCTIAGCSSPPEPTYYTLRDAAPVRSSEAKPGPGTRPVVLVDHFAIDEAYASDRIAYRQGEHELGFDPYSLWAGPPVNQVEDAVRDALWVTGLFADVRQPAPLDSGRAGADLVVTGRVARLEEVDADAEWKAALDVELYLLDGKTREVLASKRFAAVEPAEKRNPRSVVGTLAQLLGRAVGAFVVESREAIAARKPRGS